MRPILYTAVIASSLLVGTSHAQELRPAEAQSIALAEVTGTAYFMVQPSGYQLVATLAAGEATKPVRFVTKLDPGQTVMISVPREVGTPAAEIVFTRIGDRVHVARSPAAMHVN